jgi:hypothetical protein
MRLGQLTILVAGLVAVLAMGASAEPYLTVRNGAKCSDCHSNMTGGGKRLPFPYVHSHDLLHDLQILPIPARAEGFDGQLQSHVSIGGDFRVASTTVFADRPDSTGRVDRNQAFRSRVESTDLNVNELLVYGQLDLWPDVLSLYVDEDLNGGATNREAFALLRGVVPLDGYVKAGRLFPTFGLRVHDDEAFIRARTGFTFDNPDEGAEIGIQPGPFFVAASVTNGTGGDRNVQVSLNAYAVLEDLPVIGHTLVGASYARQSNARSVAGFYAGANLWRFSYLGEVDVIDDSSSTSVTARDHLAAYGEVDLLLFDWLNVRGTMDYVKVRGNRDQTRYAIGLEPFIDRYLQPRIQYRINNGPPQLPALNRPELVFELHAWF